VREEIERYLRDLWQDHASGEAVAETSQPTASHRVQEGTPLAPALSLASVHRSSQKSANRCGAYSPRIWNSGGPYSVKK
jgi:hypothetical protein